MKKITTAGVVLGIILVFWFAATSVCGPARPHSQETAVDLDGIWTALTSKARSLNLFVVTLPPYNATGDGKADDTAAIQAAINDAGAVNGDVVFPSGKKFLVSELTINSTIRLVGSGPQVRTATLHSRTDAPLLTINCDATVENLTFYGASKPTFQSQDLIVVANTNNVYLRHLFLSGGYNNVRWHDTTFRCFMQDVRLSESINSSIRTEGTSSPGCQLVMDHVTIFGGVVETNYAMLLDNVGTITMDSLIINHRKTAKGGLVVNSIAEGYGHMTMDNSIIELETSAAKGPSLSLIGTPKSGRRDGYVSYFQVSNTNLSGGGGVPDQPIIDLKYVRDSQFSNCLVIGPNTAAGIRFVHEANVKNTVFTNTNFQVGKDAIVCEDATPVINDLTFQNPYYAANFHHLVHFATADGHTLLPAGNVNNLMVRGGVAGSGVPAVNVPSAASGKYILIDSNRANGSKFNGGALKTPQIPASGAVYQNSFLVDCNVYVTGGSVSAIAINGTATGLTGGTVRVPSGGTIAVTYNTPPRWTWFGL